MVFLYDYLILQLLLMNLEVSCMQVPLKIIFRESRGGLEAETAGCSSRVPEFDSHTPRGYS